MFISVVIILITLCLNQNGAYCHFVTVPISINVEGKFVISDPSYDHTGNETYTIPIELDTSQRVYQGHKALRIRTNFKNWKLTAVREELYKKENAISPEEVKLNYGLKYGSRANPNSTILSSNFSSEFSLKKISTSKPTVVLQGVNKTSLTRDPTNRSNWVELITNYKYQPKSENENKSINSYISYSFASP